MVDTQNHRLYLFDIDGTLVSPGSISRRALDEIIEEVTGISPQLAYRDVAGQTDPAIVEKALIKLGFTTDTLAPLKNKILTTYTRRIETVFHRSNEPFLYEDGDALLQQVLARGHKVAVMTGNMETVAWMKLRRFQLDHFFPFGVFGEDVNSRMEMPKLAVERAFDSFSRLFPFEDVVVIGDTPNDAMAARFWGARSIIVCRRPEQREAIVRAGATSVVSSFNEIIPVA